MSSHLLEIIRSGRQKPHIWFEAVDTDKGPGLRVAYFARGRVFWSGSMPVVRYGDSFVVAIRGVRGENYMEFLTRNLAHG